MVGMEKIHLSIFDAVSAVSLTSTAAPNTRSRNKLSDGSVTPMEDRVGKGGCNKEQERSKRRATCKAQEEVR